MNDSTTLGTFQHAGRAHLEGARRVLTEAANDAESAWIPGSAAYLAHVSVECAIKARLLSRGGCPTVEDLARKLPAVHASLFKSKRGHDLVALAEHVRLKSFVATHGKPWRDDDCWKRMTSSDRPYSLRYGAERLDDTGAREELQRATDLVSVLLDGIKVVPVRNRRRGAR